jgi:HEPN domain-containing protein
MTSAARRWLALAEEGLETAADLLDEGLFGPASFHAQQAAEKALKAVVVDDGADPPQTHDCFYLADEADASPEVAEAADALTPFYFRARYPDAPGSEVSKQEAEMTLGEAREVVGWSTKRL